MTREQYEIQKVVRRRRAFMDAVRPLEKMKANVYASAMRPMFVHQDGRIEHGEWPQWVRDAITLLDGQIKLVADQMRPDGDNDASR